MTPDVGAVDKESISGVDLAPNGSVVAVMADVAGERLAELAVAVANRFGVNDSAEPLSFRL